MKDRERPRGANHSEQADRIQDSKPPVSLARASTRNDERVSMSPHAETEVFVREQHSSQTQPATTERDASSVDIGEYRRLREQVRALTVERNELREENSQLRDSLREFQELKEKEEQRSKQNTEATARWREKHPEKDKVYKREYMREYMRKRRAEQKKQAESATTDNSSQIKT